MFYTNQIKTQTQIKSPKKNTISNTTINIQSDMLKDNSSCFLKIFKKPKKTFKLLHLQTQSQYDDQLQIKQGLRERIKKIQSNRVIQKHQVYSQQEQQSLAQSQMKIENIYSFLRKNQQLAHCLPLTNKPISNIRGEMIKFNIAEVLKMRTKSAIKKVAVQQTQFKNTFHCNSSNSLGFRPSNSRGAQKLISKRKPHHFKSLQKQSSPNKSIEKILKSEKQFKSLQTIYNPKFLKKPKNNLIYSPRSVGHYTSRSRQKGNWQTLGFQEWINHQPNI